MKLKALVAAGILSFSVAAGPNDAYAGSAPTSGNDGVAIIIVLVLTAVFGPLLIELGN